jgi:hypothetical protein
MRIGLIFTYIFVFVILAGCTSLPPGNPPQGPITQPGKTPEEHSWDNAENYMLTSLSVYCLQNFPQGSSFYANIQEGNPELAYRTYAVLRSLRNSVPINLTNKSKANYNLESVLDASRVWILKLKNKKNGKTVWLERLTVKKKGE